MPRGRGAIFIQRRRAERRLPDDTEHSTRGPIGPEELHAATLGRRTPRDSILCAVYVMRHGK